MNGATTIQERLKDLRLNKGLKLEELAEQTGISKSAPCAIAELHVGRMFPMTTVKMPISISSS